MVHICHMTSGTRWPASDYSVDRLPRARLSPFWGTSPPIRVECGPCRLVDPCTMQRAMLKDRRILVVIQRRSAAADLYRDGLTASVTDLSKLDRSLRRIRCARNSGQVRVTGSQAAGGGSYRIGSVRWWHFSVTLRWRGVPLLVSSRLRGTVASDANDPGCVKSHRCYDSVVNWRGL